MPASRDGHRRAGRRTMILGFVVTILCTAITTTGQIISALITSPADSAPAPPSAQVGASVAAPASPVPTSPAAPAPALPAQSALIRIFSSSWIGKQPIVVKGFLDRRGQSGELCAIAAPINRDPNNSRTQRWYVSGPVAQDSHGFWETRIDIDPTETSDLIVGAVLMSSCDIGLINQLLGSYPDDSAGIPAPPRPSTPGNPDDPHLGRFRVPRPVVPPGITEPDGIPEITERVVPRHSEKLDVEQWLDRNGPKLPWATSDPITIAVPHP